MLVEILAVAVGGFLGGLARWGLWKAVPARGGRVSTFASNMVASAVLGLSTALPQPWQLLAAVGFAAGMSTMSTLAKELGDLARARKWKEFWRYLLATVILGLLAAWRGSVWAGRIVSNLGGTLP